MAEAVQWLADGTPCSARFGDRYRSRTGGLEQAGHVFLKGCGLPGAWAQQRQWSVLETGFGLGLNFLATWLAWKDDPARPALLHFTSIEAWPVAPDDLLRSAEPHPELLPLAQQLAAQWTGLQPGFHRLAFEGGRVLLTLCIGDVQAVLRELDFAADSVFLDGFDPQANPAMWELNTLKAVARLCRRGTGLATWTSVGQVRRDLRQCGFVVDRTDGLPPKRHHMAGVFEPAWELRGGRTATTTEPSTCVVVGGGLAGASVAASLARRGWKVEVLDRAAQPASGASGLPAGLLAPHVSPDDNPLSRLSRAGVRLTLQQAGALLRSGEDWQATSVLEQRPNAEPLCHTTGAWIKPGALVRAWLDQPGIHWRGGVEVARIAQGPQGWQLFGADGHLCAAAALVVVATAYASNALLDAAFPLQPVRGQLSWALRKPGDDAAFPATPMNGNGHFLPAVPVDGGLAWLCGSTFQRDDTGTDLRADGHAASLDRLRVLLPALAEQLAPEFADGTVQGWAGVRCASSDRRPLVGDVQPGLWASVAMGSRGLTFAVLCAELLAARLHGEPLPLPRKLAAALAISR